MIEIEDEKHSKYNIEITIQEKEYIEKLIDDLYSGKIRRWIDPTLMDGEYSG